MCYMETSLSGGNEYHTLCHSVVTYPHGLLRSFLVQELRSWGIKDLSLKGREGFRCVEEDHKIK